MLILLERSKQINLSINKKNVHGKWIITLSLLSSVGLLFTVLVNSKSKIVLKVISCKSFHKKGQTF
jgi:hypothetical protein